MKEAVGAVKEKTGEAIGNPNLQDRGTAETVEGKVQPLLLHHLDIGRVVTRFRPIATLRWSDAANATQTIPHPNRSQEGGTALLTLTMLIFPPCCG